MRRRAGVGAVQKQKLEQEKYKDKGTVIQENQFEQMTKQMEVFRGNLEEFATKYKNEIKKNSQFRRQFQEMCASIGVDPLASGKGFWSVLGIGDFYYELAVQIVEVCMATSYKNGGIIGLDELRDRLVSTWQFLYVLISLSFYINSSINTYLSKSHGSSLTRIVCFPDKSQGSQHTASRYYSR